MRITIAMKSFFISTVFFSSLALAQIPDEVIFHDTVFPQYGAVFPIRLSLHRRKEE